jgi:type I restriction enzyme S subunit
VSWVALGDIARTVDRRAGDALDLPVYSVTKHRGFVPSLEYFKKQVFSRDVRKYKIVEAGEFAYATIHLDEGSIGVAPERCLVSPMYSVFGTDADRVDRRFLVGLLKAPLMLARYSSLGTGSAERRRSIRYSQLATCRLLLPSLEEQRRIAEVLDRADALRAKRRETLARLDELTQSIFVDMFGDEGRWPREPLGELLLRIDSGKSPTCRDHPAGGSELGVLKLGAVSFGHYRSGENKAVVSNSDIRAADEVRAGDVLLSRKNTSELVGASVFVHDTRPGLHLPDLVFRLVSNPAAGLRPRYLRDALAAPVSRQAVRSLAGGSAASMVNISKAKLKTVSIAVPDGATQDRYVARVDQVRVAQEAAQRELALLDELFASLQQRAFRGDLFSSPLPLELADAVA